MNILLLRAVHLFHSLLNAHLLFTPSAELDLGHYVTYYNLRERSKWPCVFEQTSSMRLVPKVFAGDFVSWIKDLVTAGNAKLVVVWCYYVPQGHVVGWVEYSSTDGIERSV